MKSMKTIVLIIFIMTVGIINCHCSSEKGTAKVVINIGSQSMNVSLEQSIIDRVLRFFSTEAAAQVPSSVASITLRISAPDLGSIESRYSVRVSTITAEVPIADGKEFLRWRGKTPRMKYLYWFFDAGESHAGETVNLPITMIPILERYMWQIAEAIMYQ